MYIHTVRFVMSARRNRSLCSHRSLTITSQPRYDGEGGEMRCQKTDVAERRGSLVPFATWKHCDNPYQDSRAGDKISFRLGHPSHQITYTLFCLVEPTATRARDGHVVG